ncbi:uncharacterized protein [Littorina saxatilis]|uniref:uncharacterized protein n=1 Tax=Littorina saxatilis TaxID=31220 RepID=UPI0038B487FC
MAQMTVGETFRSWNDLTERLADFSRKNDLVYVVKYSRAVQLANKNSKQPFPDELKYAYAKLVCKYSGKGRLTGRGANRSNGSKKTECPAFIFVSADRKKGLLWIKNMMNSHNHESSNNNDAEVQLKISGVLTEIQLSCYNVHDEELERRHSALAKLLEGWQNTTSLGMNHAGPVSLSPKNIADTDEPDLGLTLPDEKLAARVKQLKSELFAIFDGTKESDRHKLYCRGGVSRRSLDGYGGLGYLQEGQEDLVMDILLSLFSKHGTLSLNMADYLMRVLLPEVVDKIFVSQS